MLSRALWQEPFAEHAGTFYWGNARLPQWF